MEFSLKGQAIEVHGAALRRRFAEAVAKTTTWNEPHFHLFAIDIDSAALIRYERGEQLVKMWPGGRERRRRYG